MSEQTKIEWADATFNPWIGCTKVSPGCAHCYAEHSTLVRTQRAHGRELWGAGKSRWRTSAATWRNPVKWNHREEMRRADRENDNQYIESLSSNSPRIFPSLMDWLDDEIPSEWLADFLKLIHDTPNLNWLLLTKRPQLFQDRLFEAYAHCEAPYAKWVDQWRTGESIPENIWVGWSAEDQKRWDERSKHGLNIPAFRRFVSVEPQLSSISFDLGKSPRNSPGIDWIIIGGESDQPNQPARPCKVKWIESGVRQCRDAGVACFVKQLGSTACGGDGDWTIKDKKGDDMSEWPQDLRVRQFPK